MNYKKIFISIFTTSLLFLFYGTAFALEVNWPTVGGLSIKSDSGIGDVARYFLALTTAAGSVIMFGVIVKSGFDFMNSGGDIGKISKAKTQMIGSAIGMIILLGVYVIINNINSDILTPKDGGTDCVMGVKRKVTITYKDSKGKNQEKIVNLCYNTDQADLTEDIKGDNVKVEDLGSTFPLCSMREVITFSEKEYQGTRTVIFKDNGVNNDNCPDASNIKFENAKSVKMIPKLDGVYVYGKNNTLPTCGKDHLTKNNPPSDLCKSPATVVNLREENGRWKWRCKGDANVEVSCWTKGEPVTTCTSHSINISSNFMRLATTQYETFLLKRLEFDWDGIQKIEISSLPNSASDVSADDLFIIKNVTDPSNVLEKLWGHKDYSAVWQGHPEIMSLLRPGKNVLEFYVQDWWADHIGCSDVYLYWCEDNPPEEDPDPDPWEEEISDDRIFGPLYFSKGVSNFSNTELNDKAQSIEIVNKKLLSTGNPIDSDKGGMDYGEFYGAVLFSEANYRGKCFVKTSRNIDQSKENNDEWASLVYQKDLATGEKVDLRGSLSSMIVFKSPLTLNEDKTMGSIDIYAVPNCGEIERTSSTDTNKYDACHVNISPGSNGFLNLEKVFFEKVNNSACQGDFIDHSGNNYPIQSFRINGAAGVVLKSDAGNCHYFDIATNERRGNCFTNLQDTFKTSLGQEKIKTIMVIPLENK